MGDMLSQAEINALLGGDSQDVNAKEEVSIDTDKKNNKHYTLTDEDKDILGEVGNINMGTSATTLSTLLGKKVSITTPKVKITDWKEVSKGYDRPCVGIRVDYTEGVEGSNILVLKDTDVKIISNLMMGEEIQKGVGEPLNEIDLSAIEETMNQMIGSSATSLASLTKTRVDIATPEAFLLDFNDTKLNENLVFGDDPIVCISFRMEIDSVVDSEIMQILPFEFAQNLVEIMAHGLTPQNDEQAAQSNVQIDQGTDLTGQMMETSQKQPVQPNTPPQQSAPQYTQQGNTPSPQYHQQQSINVQPAHFQSFDSSTGYVQKENIEIIMDVPLEVTVELGRTSKKIKEILEFAPGTVIELNKLAGEPIDILVNGKFVAKGEVVVIDENFGIRINEIINAENRI